jgi:hypothetical protein
VDWAIRLLGLALIAWGVYQVVWAPRQMARYRSIGEKTLWWEQAQREIPVIRDLRLMGVIWVLLGVWLLLEA